MQTKFNLLFSGAGLLGLLFAADTAAAAPAGIGPSFKGPIGLQLYSLREQFPKNVLGTLDEVKRFGFKYAEVAGTYGLSPEKFRQELESRGIEPIGAHF